MKNKTKNILVCVAGATPQVITETIYALSKKSPPVYIEELHVITTAFGKRLIKEKLLGEGILDRLVREYKLPPIRFTEESIIVINDPGGKPLNDIRNDNDNEATGDIITDFIRELADREDVTLHCSIAGGRKTMSFYLGSALQLFGRPQDRLYHVLVSPEFENNSEFFYPPKKPKRIRCRMPDGREKLVSTSKAEIHLADLPFVRLREKVFLDNKGFRDLVSLAQADLDRSIPQLPLSLKFKEREILIGDRSIRLTPMEFAIYALFALIKARACIRKDREYCLDCTDCFLSINDLAKKETFEKIKKLYEVMFGKNSSKAEDLKDRDGSKFLAQENFRQYRSKINKKIAKAIDNPVLASIYILTNTGRYASSRYGIRVEKSMIKKA